MPAGIYLAEKDFKAFSDYTEALAASPEDSRLSADHFYMLRRQSFSEFLALFLPIMVKHGADIKSLNDSLVVFVTESIAWDFDTAWYTHYDIFYVAAQYHAYIKEEPSSPFAGDTNYEILGDIFNNFPLTIEGKTNAPEINQLLITQLIDMLANAYVTYMLREENI